MIGPRFTIRFHGSRLIVGVADAVLCVVVFAGVLNERFGRTARPELVITGGGLLALAFFLLAILIESLRLRFSRGGSPAVGTAVCLTGATSLTVKEAGSPTASAKGGAAGMALDLAVGLIAALAYTQFNDHQNRAHDFVVAAAVGIGGSAALRFMTAPFLNGGRVVRWFLELTLDDDDTAVRGSGTLGLAVATLLFFVAVATLASEGEAAFWGLGIAVAAIDIAALTPVTVKRMVWLKTACDRRLMDLLMPQHPIVSENGPISELIPVFSLEGSRAIAVAQDRDGHQVGIVQFRQLRRAMVAKNSSQPISGIMVPLAALPHLSRETTLLDAATFLESNRRPAAVFESLPGRLNVVTADDLGCPRW